jgi:Tol biopolymer transport system component
MLVDAVPLTSYRGNEIYPGLSPDGSQVAFSWDGEQPERLDIYTQKIGDPGLPVRLTRDPRQDIGPAWSPDGKSVAFLRRQGSGDEILLASPAGAHERKLADVVYRTVSYWGPTGAGRLLTWSPDGKWLAFATADSQAGTSRLVLLSASDGHTRVLTQPEPTLMGDFAPAFSPDGLSLAFSRFVNDQQGDIYQLELSSDLRPRGHPRRLTFRNDLTLSPAWTSDGRSLVFAAGATAATMRLWKVAVAGGEPALVEIGSTPVNTVELRGSRLVASKANADIDIWAQKMGIAAPGEVPIASPPERFIASSWPEGDAQVSPDGTKIAFGSIRSGSREIYVCNVDGSNVAQLTSFGGPSVVKPRWSPDGKELAFTVSAKGTVEIYITGAAGGVPRLVHTDPALLTEVARDVLNWSRNGKWIYFISRRSGDVQSWKVPAGGGTAVQVTREGGFAAVESPDGRFVYYLKRPQPALWRVPVGGGEEQWVRDLLGGPFELVESGVYFIGGAGPSGRALLQLLSFADSGVRPVAEVDRQQINAFAVSPDGRTLLYSRTESRGIDLMLVDDFR